jgi:hypothetical protein
MVDAGWPHQIALPESVSLNNGYKAVNAFCKELSLCPRGHRVVYAGLFFNVYCFFPSAATPRNSCDGSAANGSTPSKEEKTRIGCSGRSEWRRKWKKIVRSCVTAWAPRKYELAHAA